MCDFSKINSRLEEFSRLKDGWNEGEGNPFDLLSLKKLSQCFSLNYPEYMPQPHIYPDLDDVIRFEWEFGKSHVDLDVNILNLKSTIYSYNLETDDGKLTSDAFAPRKSEKYEVSTYNGQYFTASTAFEHFTQSHNAIGIVHVMCTDCEKNGLQVVTDNHPFEGHASIVYDKSMSKGMIRKTSAKLAEIAICYGWDIVSDK